MLKILIFHLSRSFSINIDKIVYKLYTNQVLPYAKAKTNPVRNNRKLWYIFVFDTDLDRERFMCKSLSNVNTLHFA